MDPEYRAYLNHIMHHLGLEQSELEHLDPDYVEEDDEDEDEDEEEDDEDEDEEEEVEVDDEDEDEEEEEEEEEEEDERDGGNAGGVNVGGHSETASRQVLLDNRVNAINSHMAEAINGDDLPTENANEVAVDVECECSSERANIDDSKRDTTASLKGNGEENEDFNRGEIDGLFCPICFEAWSSGGGDHHVCCLPCGHIYGLSCIKKWLGRPGSSKCPQCKKKCGIKSIRLLYASRIVAVDGELQKMVKSLEAECASLKRKSADWSKKEVKWKKREADLSKEVRYLKERTHDLEDLLENMERRASVPSEPNLNHLGDSTMGPNFQIQVCTNKFVMQKDFLIPGARLFDIDSSSKIFVFARRLLGNGGAHLLTKVSLLSNHEMEDIHLPENTKTVKDLRVSPHARLVLLASLGKKLSVLSTESNNTVLTYELPAAAWSCSWDMCSSNYVYAGLQNGTVLQFDMRQTLRPVESLAGLTNNPIHTLHSLSLDSSHSTGNRSVLTASSAGLCQWNFGASEERPNLIPESDREGVCISLAYCKSSDYIVASYRPKIEISGDLGVSQPMLTAPGQAAQGSHVLYRKVGNTYQKLGASCANVSDIRLPKSAIIDGLYQNPVFASGDESRCELVFQDLPSQRILEHLKPQHYPIRDIKYNHLSNSGILGCLSEDSFQLFTAKPL